MFSVDVAGRHPVRRDTMGKRFGELAARLGHDYTLHGLRHFTATQLGAVASASTRLAQLVAPTLGDLAGLPGKCRGDGSRSSYLVDVADVAVIRFETAEERHPSDKTGPERPITALTITDIVDIALR
jgi:hypothetical protein